jgi:hypothetical protein
MSAILNSRIFNLFENLNIENLMSVKKQNADFLGDSTFHPIQFEAFRP